jgi:hypothetical protein
MEPTIRVLSLGAGVQSTTLALLVIEGTLPRLDAAIFADTGWEPASVYAHLERLTAALAQVGIPVVRVSRGNLRDDALNPDKHVNLPAFIRNPDGSMGRVRRHCTDRYKLRPIHEQVRLMLGALNRTPKPCTYCLGTGTRVAPWRAKRGEVTDGTCSVCEGEGTRSGIGPAPAGHWAEQWIGFSTDEVARISGKEPSYTRSRYPLIELGMSRTDCQSWLAARGWGTTPKSACVGCPFHGNAAWRRLRDTDPDGWTDAVDMDKQIRTRPGLRGEEFLHRSLLPLAEVDLRSQEDVLREDHGQYSLWDEDEDGDPDGCSPYGCRSGSAVHHAP